MIHKLVHFLQYSYHTTLLTERTFPVTIHIHHYQMTHHRQQTSYLQKISHHVTTHQSWYHTYQLTLIQTPVYHVLLCRTHLNHGTHRWELTGNYPVFTMVMVIYNYVDRIWRNLVTLDFCITYTIMNKYYPGEPVNIHIQKLIIIIKENNWVITTKKG